jgi:DNA-binding HxlR family transcriptional regulator
MDKRTLILKALFENQKLHFRGLTPGIDGLPNPTFTKRLLNELRKERLIKVERPRKWRGRKVFYSLTSKGRKYYLRMALDEANESLKIIQEITGLLLSDPIRQAEWRKTSAAILSQIRITPGLSLKEAIRAVEEALQKTHGPLYDSYRNIHQIICQSILPQEVRELDYFIGFNKTGKPKFIPTELLERLDKSLLT